MTEIPTRPTPFTILVDSAEQNPFTFLDLRADAAKKNVLWDVRTESACLGRYPNSRGDYSLYGYENSIGVERKSVADLQTTLLNFSDGGRDRFENELGNLSQLDAAVVIVEGSLEEVIATITPRGTKSIGTLRKILFRSIVAVQQDYRVPIQFAGSRRLAEQYCFRFLERFWEKRQAEIRKANRESANDALRLLESM